MEHMWMALLFLLHRGYSLISVTSGQLGQPVTFTCSFPGSEYGNTRVKWYRQNIGDTLKLITDMLKGSGEPTFEPGFSPSRFEASFTTAISSLTILTTIPEDEAIYHCAFSTWAKDEWNGTYLYIEGSTGRKSSSTVTQWPAAAVAVQPGDSVTLHCSVFSPSERSSCAEDDSVHWFGVRSDQSPPNVIYTHAATPDGCVKEPEASSPSRRCVYRLSKNISASDSGTFYCALAKCGEIVFGSGTKLDLKDDVSETSVWSFPSWNLVLLSVSAAVSITSLIVTSLLIYVLKTNKCGSCKAAASMQENIVKRSLKREVDRSIYSAAVFVTINTSSGDGGRATQLEREKTYAAVQAFGLY